MEKLPSVLLVDDDETANFLNEHLLRRLGVAERVHVVEDGAQALALLTRPEPLAPTLLLLDLKMPVMDGVEFLQAFRQLPAAQQQATVVLVLTTSLDPTDMQRLHGLPFAELLSKPLSRDKVGGLLQRHFGRELAR